MIRWLRIVLLALLAALVLGTTVVNALTNLPDSTPTVVSKKFYRNLLQTGDRLLVVYANIPYAALPMDTVTEVFIWELVNSDNITIYGSTVGYAYVTSGYRYNVFSMYFPASDAVPWDPASAHVARLRGNPIQFASPPVYDYSISSSDYSTSVNATDSQAELAADILVIADDLDFRWGLTDSLINEDDTGQTLSTLGQAFFRGAIYGIQSLAPSLFPLGVSDINLTDRAWTDAYVTQLQNQYTGSWLQTVKAAGATLFGTDYDLLSLIILLSICIAVLFGNIYLTNDHWNGLADVAFVLVIGTKIGWLGLGYLSLMVAVAWIYTGIRFWGLGKS